MIKEYVSKGARIFAIYLALHFVYLFLLRCLFLFVFRSEIPSDRFGELVQSFYIGTKFDVRLVAILSLPFAFILLWPRVDVTKNYFVKKFTKNLSTTIIVIVLLYYFFDFGFFAYLHSRINAASLKFLENPWISAQMIWQSYPVIWGVLGVAAFAHIHYRFVSWIVSEEVVVRHHYTKKRKFFSFFFCFLFWLGAIYGKMGFYPLRWSEAYFSTNSFVSNFALNPVLNFFDTLRFVQSDFDKSEVKKYYLSLSKYFGVDNPNEEDLNFKRIVKPQTQPVTKPNIVIIVLESLAGNKSSLFGNKLDPTPYLKKIQEESLFFTHHFSPTEATARAIFATMTGIPDVSSAKTSSRNPLVVNQHTIMNEFKDYEKFYFLGGSANWGNIRGIFSYNVDDVNIYEESNLESPRNDVWGVSDLDLFIEANQILKKQSEKPFIALIQSAGFHRPYTIPVSSEAFIPQLASKDDLHKYSFSSLEEYNSLRFQDYSFGHYMNLAKQEKYYENTIFIIFGDHGLPAPQSENMSLGFIDFQLTIHHTPLVIHGPKFFKPKVIEQVTSQLDILPTVASLAGIEYTNTTMGRNIFATNDDKTHYAFTYSWHEIPPQKGLVDKEFYFTEGPKYSGLFRYQSETPTEDVSSQFPEKYQEMKNLCRGFYETAKYLLYHNPKMKK